MDRERLVTNIKEDLKANWERDTNGFLAVNGGDLLHFNDGEREQIGQEIENFMEFTREVLNDPSILDHIPDGSQVEAVFREDRDPTMQYDIETPRMVAIVTPPAQTSAKPVAGSRR